MRVGYGPKAPCLGVPFSVAPVLIQRKEHHLQYRFFQREPGLLAQQSALVRSSFSFLTLFTQNANAKI